MYAPKIASTGADAEITKPLMVTPKFPRGEEVSLARTGVTGTRIEVGTGFVVSVHSQVPSTQ